MLNIKKIQTQQNKIFPFYFLTIRFTPNNCLITIKDSFKTLKTMSIGQTGYKNTQKSSEIAHIHLIDLLLKYLQIKNIKKIILQFKGLKKFRKLFYKALVKEERKIKIIWIMNQTPINHNGCRKIKKRRL